MLIESLEGRRLLTAVVTDGVLTITGGDTNDHVQVRLDAGDSGTTDDDTVVVIERTETTSTTDDSTATTTSLRRFGRRGGGGGGGGGRLSLSDAVRTEFNIADEGVTSIVMDLGDGNDRASVARAVTLAATINGGAGDDRLSAGGGATTVNGGDGDDRIRGGSAADVLNGDAGNDVIYSKGGGVDTVDGGDDGSADGSTGDIAYVDGADDDMTDDDETTDDGETTTTEPDVVTNVEAVRTAPDSGFGFGHGFGGLGGCGAGEVPSDSTSSDGSTDGTTDSAVVTVASGALTPVAGGFSLRPFAFGRR